MLGRGPDRRGGPRLSPPPLAFSGGARGSISGSARPGAPAGPAHGGSSLGTRFQQRLWDLKAEDITPSGVGFPCAARVRREKDASACGGHHTGVLSGFPLLFTAHTLSVFPWCFPEESTQRLALRPIELLRFLTRHKPHRLPLEKLHLLPVLQLVSCNQSPGEPKLFPD